MNSTAIAIIIAVAVVVVIALIVIALVSRRGSRLRPLPEGARERYAAEWRAIEGRFLDEPQEAVREADRLVASLARERGAEPERVVDDQRDHLADRSAHDHSMTEHLREAMVGYRKKMEDLLGDDPRDVARRRTEVAG